MTKEKEIARLVHEYQFAKEELEREYNDRMEKAETPEDVLYLNEWVQEVERIIINNFLKKCKEV